MLETIITLKSLVEDFQVLREDSLLLSGLPLCLRFSPKYALDSHKLFVFSASEGLAH